MTLELAQNLILEKAKFDGCGEFASLERATGKILAQDVVAVKNLPSFDNAAMDGYALKFDDFNEPLSVAATVLAGDEAEIALKKGECVKIMTGAKMPTNADTVVPFEDAILQDGKLSPQSKVKKFNALRYKGEEVKAGEILLRKGEILTPARVMMLAAQGIYCVCVERKLRIGIFSSGDEVVEPWQNASEEQIYNANGAGIASLLQSFGFASSYAGIIKDDLESTTRALETAEFDVIITSGGASKGEADFMKTALLNLGFSELFDGVNIRPGRPSKAFIKDKKIVFILPGNPMAAFLMCFLLVVPFLKGSQLEKIDAALNQDVKIKSGRENIVLGSFLGGKFSVTDNNKFGSGMITPLIKSNAVLVTSESLGELKAGEIVKILKFS
ncbi:molybdopterin molybdotransferase MoeA [uncultured Campylobacter sp.]|uniref:molybdopterin molybdotransferase MoeA n=1 Tax=uncultured Campylobacter sp. TaxID=218934 RepID=UPI0028E22BEC|nr:molybdopterin molybdotransferase MoeA [uncultured Campylobacter sp.]